MINVGIIGATGYSGEELIKILLHHPQVRITSLSSRAKEPKKIAALIPALKSKTELLCEPLNIREIISKCDLVFLALPHTASMPIAPKLLSAGKRVIDLSADYRLKDIRLYKKFYGLKHKDTVHLKEAVYGLPELYRNKIKDARLIANPGCYPTVSILALAPIIALNLIETDSIIIDAKSGVTGAGKKLVNNFLFSEVNEDFKAYKVNVHQHIPEINQVLSKLAGKRLGVTFVPHLLPVNRGILATIYVCKSKNSRLRKQQDVISLYKKFYKKEPFIRIREEGNFPRLKDVVGTNFCDIGIREEKDSVIIIAAIDNLFKGASGEAVQNMNIMYHFPEYTALV